MRVGVGRIRGPHIRHRHRPRHSIPVEPRCVDSPSRIRTAYTSSGRDVGDNRPEGSAPVRACTAAMLRVCRGVRDFVGGGRTLSAPHSGCHSSRCIECFCKVVSHVQRPCAGRTVWTCAADLAWYVQQQHHKLFHFPMLLLFAVSKNQDRSRCTDGCTWRTQCSPCSPAPHEVTDARHNTERRGGMGLRVLPPPTKSRTPVTTRSPAAVRRSVMAQRSTPLAVASTYQA